VRESKEFKYFDLEAIFVSVDPDRDSNERIEEYCKIFDEKLVGLTHKSNSHVELKDMLKKFKIHVSKIYLTDEEEKEDLKTL
jgi:cytochrome oxidase Cu insertion factor (SCO1/SenC/PrrC family)